MASGKAKVHLEIANLFTLKKTINKALDNFYNKGH